jgi:hypothetical protein
MQNFGRGMWRRVGDFERIQVPQIIKHSQLQQALQYKEYITNLQQQKYIEEYRKKMLEKVNTQVKVPVEDEVELVSHNIKEQIIIEEPLEIKQIEQIEQIQQIKQIEQIEQIEQIKKLVVEETPIIEIIAVEPEIPIQKEEKKPIIFPKKGRKRR